VTETHCDICRKFIDYHTYSLRPKITQSRIHTRTTNLNKDLYRFVVLGWVTSYSRLSYFRTEGVGGSAANQISFGDLTPQVVDVNLSIKQNRKVCPEQDAKLIWWKLKGTYCCSNSGLTVAHPSASFSLRGDMHEKSVCHDQHYCSSAMPFWSFCLATRDGDDRGVFCILQRPALFRPSL
jgi:hypothetical protein